jgi:hypothetical protein
MEDRFMVDQSICGSQKDEPSIEAEESLFEGIGRC